MGVTNEDDGPALRVDDAPSGSGPAVPQGFRSGTARANCTPRARRRECSLEFLGPRDSAYRAGTGVWPDGGTGLELLDEGGTLRARLGPRADVGAPTLEPYGADGAFRAAMGEYPDGSGRVNLWDADGRSIAE